MRSGLCLHGDTGKGEKCAQLFSETTLDVTHQWGSGPPGRALKFLVVTVRRLQIAISVFLLTIPGGILS